MCCVTTGTLEGVPGIDGAEGGYIGAFGTDLQYRKHVLGDEKTRPGNALMQGGLETIQAMFGGPPMVFVFAKVKRSNIASTRLFDEHGFDDTRNAAGEHVLLRPPDLDPGFRRRPSWAR